MSRSVEVRLLDPARGARWHAMEVVAMEGDVFGGWWRRFGDFILTYATAVPTDHPVSLIDPPRLETATPAHSWMDAPRR